MKFDYFKRWRRQRLYKQWVKSSALSLENVPQNATARNVLPEIDAKRWRLPILYTLLGIAIGVMLTTLIFFVTKSC